MTQTNQKLFYFHIVILLIGAVYLISGSFYTAIWFDESYTVGLMEQDFFSMCRIAAHDVHPLLYYIMLKGFTFLFGNSIIVMRLFSVLGGISLSVLGFTHIRRDFGERTGIWYSFFCLALPVMFKYALQIRMYTWAPFFVTLTAIYAYRMVYISSSKKKSFLLFTLFSIAAAYTHYFALFASAWINFMLLIYNRRQKKPFREWLIPALIQIVAYLPGIFIFLKQIGLEGASWIQVTYPDVLANTLNFFFIGDTVEDAINLTNWGYLFLTLLSSAVYLFYFVMLLLRLKTNKNSVKAPFLSLILMGCVIVFSLAVSLFRPIYYVRYTMVLYGLAAFFFADLTAKIHTKFIKVLCVVIFLLVTVLRVFPIYRVNYDPSTSSVEYTLDGQIQNGDVFLMDDNNGSSITVKYPELELYFYNKGRWNVEDSYLAFGHHVHILESLEDIRTDLTDYTGNIWILKSDALCEMAASLPGAKKVKTITIHTAYYNQTYELVLFYKNS